MKQFFAKTRAGCGRSFPSHLQHKFATHSVFLGAVCLATFAHNSAIKAESAESPNIIYIMTDDLGYGDLGCYGQRVIQTPNIDRLAAEGIRFTDHYAGHTVCRPSRLVLWTGRHVGHTGLTGNRPYSLSGMESTVAQRLKSAGYATGGVGKWALGHVNEPKEIFNDGHPNNNGFDYWMGYMNQSNAHNYYPEFLYENTSRVFLPGNVIDDNPIGRGRVSSKRVTYSHDVMTQRAFEFIEEHSNEPFLLHIHWTIPHANNEGGRVTGDGMEVPDYGPYDNEDWPHPEKGFAAMISHMDRDVGRLMKLLVDLNLDERTLVIFTSDNGPHNEGGHKHDFFDSNGPLNGFKRSMHEGGVRVPLIARWPGKITPGAVSNHPSAFWDFLPTACQIAGIPVADDANIDGISYLPTLLGKPDEQKTHEYLYWESLEGQTSVGVRMDDWKLVQYRQPRTARTGQPDWRLYDLDKDLGETENVADEHPQVVKQMLGLLRRDSLQP